jgi:hypothetical protein
LVSCSNPGHPFAAGLALSKLSAVTVDNLGKETFATGGALDRVKKVCHAYAIHFISMLNLISLCGRFHLPRFVSAIYESFLSEKEEYTRKCDIEGYVGDPLGAGSVIPSKEGYQE